MKSEIEIVTDAQMIIEVVNACCRAAERGTSEQQIAENLLIAAVSRLFVAFGEDIAESALRNALHDIETGNFALKLEEAGLIKSMPVS